MACWHRILRRTRDVPNSAPTHPARPPGQLEPADFFASDRSSYFVPLAAASSAFFSSARAALRMFLKPRLPSWQEYSSTGCESSMVSGIANVHGFVHVIGSSMVTAHFTVLGA